MKHFIPVILCFTFLFSAALLPAQTSQLAVVPVDSPDPTAIQTPDGFYAFATGKTIKIFYSKNLLDWKLLPDKVFKDDIPAWARERIKGTRRIWAPDTVFHNGQYYLYYSVSTFGGQRSLIGLAVNKTLNPQSPDYEWQDRGIVLESHPEHTDYNAIDSAFFADDDGKAYLVWGSYWTGIKGVEVNSETGKPFKYRDGDLKIPLDYKTIANRSEGRDDSIEAPYIIKRNGYYHLFTSRGSCCDGVRSTYHIVIGRGKSPLGPYFGKDGKRMDEGGGTLLLESSEKWKGPGHNGVLHTTGDAKHTGDWLFLHAYNADNAKAGRLTQIRPLYWDEDGWMKSEDILSVPFEKFDFSSQSR